MVQCKFTNFEHLITILHESMSHPTALLKKINQNISEISEDRNMHIHTHINTFY